MFFKSPNFSLLSIIISVYVVVRAQQPLESKLVDDGDTYALHRPDGIQYHPSWRTSNGNAQRMNSTYHFSKQRGTNLVYFFQGNAIYYYADERSDYAPAKIYFDGDDQGETVLSNSSSLLVCQRLIWSRTNLGPGDHQIVISHNGSNGKYVGLDYFRIESDHGFTPTHAGPAASTIPREAVIVDDDNLEYVHYSEWDPKVHNSGGRQFHYNNTMHITDKPGSFVTFKFNGTAVWYVTDYYPDHGLVNITLDGGPGELVNGRSSSNAALLQRILWNATDLEYGEHTVVITHSDTAGTWASLDYFRYLPGEPEASQRTSPTGKIVGGTIGGLVIFALSIAGCTYIRRRRASKLAPPHYLGSCNPSGPPLLNPSVEGRPQAIFQPTWGYITEPFMPQGDPTTSRDNAHRPSKCQLSRTPTQPISDTTISSSSASSTQDYTESETTDNETELRTNTRPPPYA